MRVTHVITRLIVGGAQENTVATVLGLREKTGVEVDLVTGPTAGREGTLEHLLEGKVPLALEPHLVRPVHPFHDVLVWRRLTRRFRRTQPDLVHTHSGKAGVIGRLAAARAGVRVIVHTIHGPSFGPFQGALANQVFRQAEQLASRVTTHFISVAEAMTEQYLAAGIGRREQYSTIWSGFELAPFLSAPNDPALRSRLGIGPEDLVIGKIARLFKLKGHDDLFAAAPEIIRQVPQVKFLLVGDGPWRDRFERQLSQCGLKGHFIFTGLVPPTEVARHVGLMDVLVHLSRREGLPRALPQALAAGKPVVAYDCDGAREVCVPDQTGFLLPPGDQAGLIKAVVTLAQSPALRHQLGERGRQLARDRFEIGRMVDAIHTCYLNLLSGRSPHRS